MLSYRSFFNYKNDLKTRFNLKNIKITIFSLKFSENPLLKSNCEIFIFFLNQKFLNLTFFSGNAEKDLLSKINSLYVNKILKFPHFSEIHPFLFKKSQYYSSHELKILIYLVAKFFLEKTINFGAHLNIIIRKRTHSFKRSVDLLLCFNDLERVYM